MTTHAGRVVCLGVAVLIAIGLATAGSSSGEAAYPTVEVARFQVDRENYSTKELERAGKIPEEALDDLQRALVGVLTRSGKFESVRKPAEEVQEGESILSIEGRVVDYKPGNRSARILVGMGAGAQKFEVECVLKDRVSGKVLGKKRIIDRKWAGITGGDEDKGLTDFAEKVLEFMEKTLDKK